MEFPQLSPSDENELLSAIEQGDAQKARQLVHDHIEIVEDHLESAQPDALRPDAWMTQFREHLSTRSFATICAPRSHDSGTYVVKYPFRLGSKSTVQTHATTILQQLRLGFRVFDIRPTLRGGIFSCSHYTYIDKLPDWADGLFRSLGLGHLVDKFTGWYSGGDGASLDELIDQVNNFTRNHSEAIVLEMSHTYNFDREKHRDRGSGEWTPEEWRSLFQRLTRLDNRFILPTGSKTLVKDVKFGDMIGRGKSAIIITVPDEVSLSDFAGQGFYSASHFANLVDRSATHMQDTNEAIFAFLHDLDLPAPLFFMVKTAAKKWGGPYIARGAWSILEQAILAQQDEMPMIEREISEGKVPNYLTTDHIRNVDACRLATQMYRQ